MPPPRGGGRQQRTSSRQQQQQAQSHVHSHVQSSENRQPNSNSDDDIAEILTEIRNELRNTRHDLMNEINELKKSIQNLNKKIEEKDEIIDNQQYQITTIETDFHNLLQYNRRECIEIAGIPETVLDVNLEDTALKIFSTIDVEVEKHQIHACHRLPKKQGSVLPKRTIIRFVNRKTAELIKRNKKFLKEKIATAEDLDFDTSKLYINENLCAPYKTIWSMVRKLHKSNHIFSFWTYNGIVHYKTEEEGPPLKVFHKNMLFENFPLFNFV